MENVQFYTQQLTDLAFKLIPQLLLAIVVLILGLWAIKFLGRGINRALEKSKVDVSLQKFLVSLISIGFKILLLISIASMLGIATTSFVTIIGAMGLAVGLALQGSLANFAGGVLILLLKPFKVGDVIDAQGFIGKVDQIQIFNTILKTFDNKTIFIPNAALSNGNITNYSIEPTRRVDMTFGIGYNDDLKKAKQILTEMVEKDERILKEPAPTVALAELGDSSVNFAVRVWVKQEDFWNVYYDFQENVKLTFDAQGISIPYPQHDVHLYQVDGGGTK
ncbi:MscS Mechanosensitive ion channel [Caldithrix abyssi DSM 13497]|uniref:MscS Mechanosensitive ion channel n=1 Tax=Caldithrix abyssi DSM 13497 TaxID=880073 RepID=H1XX60_CALAY|nr:mechanosensitive ion channel domain-containing protein [Caldithrix abyssi]APF20704.1 small conductance mechanosensitive channel [Caldithrix abyssi DSM 13497]EHO40797.1 MscS Mechanosensitive ion channel [Caldithrix abyssi DSM 13497]